MQRPAYACKQRIYYFRLLRRSAATSAATSNHRGGSYLLRDAGCRILEFLTIYPYFPAASRNEYNANIFAIYYLLGNREYISRFPGKSGVYPDFLGNRDYNYRIYAMFTVVQISWEIGSTVIYPDFL
eukprot:g46014.t1